MNVCPICKTELAQNAHFCHNCGQGITETATALKKLEEKNAQISILGHLSTAIKNPQDLLIIKNLINKLK